VNFLLLVACSRDQATPDASDYFIGTWELRANPITPSAGTTVTLEKDGKATFHLTIASSTGTDQYITKSWEYDEETKELTFDAPSDVYRVIEKKTDQFTAVRPTTNAGLIFVKK
jgi:hypothetical protein